MVQVKVRILEVKVDGGGQGAEFLKLLNQKGRFFDKILKNILFENE